MDNRNQVESKEKLLANIKQSITKDDFVLEVQDCYLGYVELTVYFKKLYEAELSPIAVGILELLEVDSPQKIEELSDLFCADEATIYHAIQQLQYAHTIKVTKGEYIVRTEDSNRPSSEVYSQSIVVNPQTLKIVDFDPIYHVPTEWIVPSDNEMTVQDVIKLLPHLHEEQVEQWICQQVAGPHMYQVTLYNQQQKLQRKVLFNEDGHELHEVERIEVDLSHVLLNQKQPDAIIDFGEVPAYLQKSESSWVFAVKGSIPKEIQSYVQSASTSTLLLIEQVVLNEELKAIYLMETRSKGMLTVFEVTHEYDLLYLSKKNMLQSTSDNQIALHTDELLIQAKHRQMQTIIVELAKETNSKQALKAFIYLVEQQTEVEIIKSIIEELAKSSSSNDLIHRGKVLDNYALYKTLAKEAYELGIQAHAREVKL